MSLLILQAPAASGAGAWRWVGVDDAGRVLAPGQGSLATVPRPPGGTLTVLLVPAENLSWHRLVLPPRSVSRAGAARVRAVLDGALEDRLLDEPARLHLALAPGAADAAGQAPAWVAACAREPLEAWLREAQSAGLNVDDILPGALPLSEDEAPRLSLRQGSEGAWLIAEHAAGVAALPWEAVRALPEASRARLIPGWTADGEAPAARAVAEPALAAELDPLRPSASAASVATAADQAALAVRAALDARWSLAQFDLANDRRAQAAKRSRMALAALLRAPEWRVVRWGLAALAAANLVGLNAWAWHQARETQDRQAEAARILQTTFPKVRVVLDAPLQMQREMHALEQAAGQLGPQDMEAQLQALAAAVPPDAMLSAIEFADQRLRAKGLSTADADVERLAQALRPRGLGVQRDGDVLRVAPLGSPP
jgi:general secretion pathway protein L